MKYYIEVEEKVSNIHRIIVEANNPKEIDIALTRGDIANNLESYLKAIKTAVKVVEVYENYHEDGESIEYYDCREIEDAEENTQ